MEKSFQVKEKNDRRHPKKIKEKSQGIKTKEI